MTLLYRGWQDYFYSRVLQDNCFEEGIALKKIRERFTSSFIFISTTKGIFIIKRCPLTCFLLFLSDLKAFKTP